MPATREAPTGESERLMGQVPAHRSAWLVANIEGERAAVLKADVRPWPGGEEAFLRIVPTRITGRRIRHHDA